MEKNPDTFESALGQLRLKLLDLTGRNRLINFRHTAGKSLQFVEGYPSAIFQKLVEGNKLSISIQGLPEPGKEEWVERNGHMQRPDPREWARLNGVPTNFDIPVVEENSDKAEVRALMYPDDLAKHCRKIEREARLAIEETGANMLFLVLGFLEFPDQHDSDRTFLAPLISIPVWLQKKEVTGIQKFSLQYTGDDISENLSLREKLREDFGMVMPELSEDKIDVNSYFSDIQKIIKESHGFSLKNRVSLCLLSFSNMWLVRDLDPTKWPQNDDKNALTDHPIVRTIFEGNSDGRGSGLSYAEEHPVEEGSNDSIPLIYDADSSQYSALIDVLSLKKNIVIEGPPGTGKSQTITNLIAACLAEGKKVLFVAEKLAALEVVKNRLSLAGLDPFVLELHSNKTSRKQVLEEIAERVNLRLCYQKELPSMQQQLESYRHDLKTYSDCIGSDFHSSFGLTLHHIIWRTEINRQFLNTEEESLLSQITVDDAIQIHEPELKRRMDSLEYLGTHFEGTGGINNPFWGFYPDRSILGNDLVRLSQQFEASEHLGKSLLDAAKHLSSILGGKVHNFSLDSCVDQLVVLNRFQKSTDQELPFHLIPRFFQNDQTGEKANYEFDVFEKQVDQFHRLEKTVNASLMLETNATESCLKDLKNLQKSARKLGVKLGNLDELYALHQQLVEAAYDLASANVAITRFFGERNIPYDKSRQKLDQFLGFADIVQDAPEEHFHLWMPSLIQDESLKAIEQLSKLQKKWGTLEKKLEGYLNLNNLPQKEDIKQAIYTLREGDAWYRVFQTNWREAVRTHKELQRFKTNAPAQTRLEQLEQVLKLIELKEEWKGSSSWAAFLDTATPKTSLSLNGYLALARWYREIKLSSKDIQAVLFDSDNITADEIRFLYRSFSDIKIEIKKAINAFNVINEKFERLSKFSENDLIDKVLEKTNEFARCLAEQFEWLESKAKRNATIKQVIEGCDAALARSTLISNIQNNYFIIAMLIDFYKGTDTDCSIIKKTLDFAQSINDLDLPPLFKKALRSNHPIETCHSIIVTLEEVSTGLRQVQNLASTLSNFGKFQLDAWTKTEADGDFEVFVEALNESIQGAVKNIELLGPWSDYSIRRKNACELTLGKFVELLENEHLRTDVLHKAYAYCVFNSIIHKAFRDIPELDCFTGLKHNKIRESFKELDKKIIALRGKAIAYRCFKNAKPLLGNPGSQVDDLSEMNLLNRLMPQQRPRMPVRKFLSRAGRSIQEFKPCFMMGPQAVAQYLEQDSIRFDVVIMDEASQLKPEVAIGSIARGTQLVVVGDPKQLPPTSFFSRMGQSEDDDDQFTVINTESILDVCSSHFRPTRALRWHYRSQHHSLIAFSNHSFYQNNLVVFPSPYSQGGNLGTRAVYVADAIYENQINIREAKRVIDAVVEHILTRQEDSLGVITMNIKQRDLIAELLEERLKTVRRANAYCNHWAGEGRPLFVKSLENVQGDERDAIIISTTYGRPPGSNSVRQNFGPISRHDGWRRLNVLFTRARKSVVVYTSMRPDDIVIDDATPRGTKELRNYLEYVRTGILTSTEETAQEPDSDFEILVMNVLRQKNYQVTPQLGVAGVRIDIAVKHPDAPNSYLAAIECDGATYHSALSVRDRDRIRQEILESLGWKGRIWRIWSIDWFRDPRRETKKLIAFLENLRRQWKSEHSSGNAWTEEGLVSDQLSVESTQQSQPTLNPAHTEEEFETVSLALIDTEDNLEIEVGD
ncbi:MAG: DUF4011 domain-containing protein [Azoarcus sp.]|nr:DUF4011 domain-containing protein [Azoarcus sp.]